MAGVTKAPQEVRFLFPNHDGISITSTVDPLDTVLSIKLDLMKKWPPEIEAADGPTSLRLICMGRILSENKTIEQCSLPQFTSLPTPINVAIRPKGFAKSARDSGDSATKSSAEFMSPGNGEGGGLCCCMC
jgi:hypothetical protein